MHPDDELQTTLSKWPFILGDVLLVGTALAIAMLGGWQLTDWQVGACVAAVALGAALFVLPYVVEYYVRVREEREDRAADLRVLEKHILNAEQALGAVDTRMRALERAAAEADPSNAALTELFEQKFVQLEATRASQEKSLQSLKNDFVKLAEEVPPPFDPQVLEPIEVRLQALEARPVATEPEPVPAPEAEATGVEPLAPEKEASPESPIKTVTPMERPKRSARERRGPEESRLIQRAISEKGDHSSTAVSRIIASKPKKQEVVELHDPESEVVESEVVEPETPVADTPASALPADQEENAEPLIEASPVRPELEAPAETEVSTESNVPTGSNKEEVAEAPQTEAAEAAQPPDSDAPEGSDAGLLFDADKIASPLRRTKAKKHDAVVTASVFIGIGNKPYLRGSGGGLNWEQGQLMEFEEIGKWRWVAPSGLDQAIEVQVFCNDDDPDKSGKHTLEPGQKLDLSPVF